MPKVFKRKCIKYNTSILTSYHVERLFKAGGHLFCDKNVKTTCLLNICVNTYYIYINIQYK